AMYAEMKGVGLVLLATTGYTGSGGYEVYVPNTNVEKAWNAIMEAGKPFGLKPTGLAARDTLRLEMGFCLYGNDIDDKTSPLEAGLGWITKFTKEFTNSKALKEQKERGVEQKLVGFELIDRGIPRHDHPVVDANGSVIGRVTSGTMGPTVQKPIGMAYVPTANAGVGSEILIDVRGKRLKGIVVKLPFYTGS
ncbi:MAG: glycine cleavage system aminomethyltransferase GcvT, partial [Flavobacteriales bacterium]|nr:glycine cleavage system aminomethyltransferase GcvT [Flavobacteriales bacterium]